MRIDHVAIGASTLDTGADWAQAELGIRPTRGGKHAAMGTHNLLFQSGGGTYAEIIAIDPEAPDPARNRWFSLGDPATQARLADGPAPLMWVVATGNIDRLVADSPVDLGEVLTLSRDDLRWKITVPRDGSRPGAGLIPAFIEWPDGMNPAGHMDDLGLALRTVTLGHPHPRRLEAHLDALGVAGLARIVLHPEPKLGLTFDTPVGERSI